MSDSFVYTYMIGFDGLLFAVTPSTQKLLAVTPSTQLENCRTGLAQIFWTLNNFFSTTENSDS
jgi:hypothetical protein